MQRLITYAEREKPKELYGQVLASNTTMLQMCAEMGFEIGTDAHDLAIRTVRLELNRGGQATWGQTGNLSRPRA